MPYIAGIGHQLDLSEFLERFSFEDFDEAECALEEAGLSIFTNDSEKVFVVITDKYKIIDGGSGNDDYVDLDFKLSPDESKILAEYTCFLDKRIKLFWVDPDEEASDDDKIEVLNNLFETACLLNFEQIIDNSAS